MEFISISRILKQAPSQHIRAYLYAETDDNDVTYFIVHQLKTISLAIQDLFKYLARKADELKTMSQLIRRSPTLQVLLNHRQIVLLTRAMKSPDATFYIESHRGAHNVTYDTARTDLLKLTDLGLLEKTKIGRAFAFFACDGLEEKLKVPK